MHRHLPSLIGISTVAITLVHELIQRVTSPNEAALGWVRIVSIEDNIFKRFFRISPCFVPFPAFVWVCFKEDYRKKEFKPFSSHRGLLKT